MHHTCQEKGGFGYWNYLNVRDELVILVPGWGLGKIYFCYIFGFGLEVINNIYSLKWVCLAGRLDCFQFGVGWSYSTGKCNQLCQILSKWRNILLIVGLRASHLCHAVWIACDKGYNMTLNIDLFTVHTFHCWYGTLIDKCVEPSTRTKHSRNQCGLHNFHSMFTMYVSRPAYNHPYILPCTE